MKNILIIAVLAVAGYFAYDYFTADSFVKQVTNELHEQAPMLDKGRLRSCVKSNAAKLSDREKEAFMRSLGSNSQSSTNIEEMVTQMEASMLFFGEVMECVNR